MQNRFTDWGLTPAEKDVALFIVKGFSIQEISGLRETSDGTVKAQMAAIYRKAGVSSRAQLVTLFIDHLIDPFPDGQV
jgi:DNA-binding NarL/FixJ family response regulator